MYPADLISPPTQISKVIPNVRVMLENINFNLRLDTGADRSCLSKRAWEIIARQNKLLNLSQSLESVILAIGSNKFRPLGQVTLRITFGSYLTEQCFFVFDGLSQDGILGLDCMWDNNMDVLVSQNKITFSDGKLVHQLNYTNEVVDTNAICKIYVEDLYKPPFHNEILDRPCKKAKPIPHVIPFPSKKLSEDDISLFLDEFCDLIVDNNLVHHDFGKLKDLNQIFTLNEIILPVKPKDKTFDEILKDLMSVEMCISDDQKIVLENFLVDRRVNFKDNPGCNTLVTHKINTGSHPPIQKWAYKTTPKKKLIIEEQIEEMLRDKRIIPSHSDWSSPVVLVGKPDGSSRFCIDYRALNLITESDQYPMPRIDEIIQQLNGSHVISSVDLCCGYWQVRMDRSDQKKTAFVCHKGLFEFTVMPFGLKTAPATFNRMMAVALKEEIGKIAFTYIDDVIIYSRTFEEHLQHLRIVFDRLLQANLFIKLKKSQFCKKQSKFLGKIVENGFVKIDPNKKKAITEFIRPGTVKCVQKFLGMTGWLREHVKNYAILCKPLYALTSKKNKFKWTTECESAFTLLKQALLSNATDLILPNYKRHFVIETDASDEGLGAVLKQPGDDGQLRVVEFASRVLHDAEKNYSTTEKECLAVVWSLQKFRGFVSDSKITIVTDHCALRWLLKTKDIHGRLTRWALRLMEFDYSIEYRKGKENVIADALSRATVLEELEDTDIDLERIAPPLKSINALQFTFDLTFLSNIQELVDAQNNDQSLVSLRNKILEYISKNPSRKFFKNYILLDNVLCYKKLGSKLPPKPVIPGSLVDKVMKEFHDKPEGGHLGRDKTIEKISARVFWKNLAKHVKEYVQTCHTCQVAKHANYSLKGPMMSTHVSKPMELVALDLMGPYPRSKWQNCYLLVIIDYYSKWVEAFPLRNANTTAVAKILRDFFCRYGVPERILSDNGPQFVSSTYNALCKLWRVKPIHTTRYHAQTDATERTNKVIKGMIRAFVHDDHREWDKLIPQFLMAIRSAKHRTTGFSPAKLFLGREIMLPWDKVCVLPSEKNSQKLEEQVNNLDMEMSKIFDLVSKHVALNQAKQKLYYDKHVTYRSFKVGDIVKVRMHTLSDKSKNYTSKFEDVWKGPYLVKSKYNDLVYELENLNHVSVGKYNIANLELYRIRQDGEEFHLPPDDSTIAHTHGYSTRSKK